MSESPYETGSDTSGIPFDVYLGIATFVTSMFPYLDGEYYATAALTSVAGVWMMRGMEKVEP